MVSAFARWTLVAAGSVALAAGAAVAQDQDERRWPPGGTRAEATIYRDSNYRGPAVAVEREQPDLRLSWGVRSIRVRGGTWQLCPETNYRGNCITVDRDTPDLGLRLGLLRRLQSMRPLGGSGGGGGGEAPGDFRSLRGMASEFYPAPSIRGEGRVPGCRRGSATAACAKQSADQFCRQAGWNGSARQALETVERRVYLADTLCVRSGY